MDIEKKKGGENEVSRAKKRQPRSTRPPLDGRNLLFDHRLKFVFIDDRCSLAARPSGRVMPACSEADNVLGRLWKIPTEGGKGAKDED